jgi:hypothetical protein
MEIKSILLCSQEPTTGPSSEWDESRPRLPICLCKAHFILISFQLHIILPVGIVPSCCPAKTLCISHISHASYMRPHLISLNLIALIMFCEQYKFWSFSVWNFLKFLFISCPVSHNILLSTLFSNTLTTFRSSLKVRDQVSHPYKRK